MPLTICVLASGSSGNSTYISDGECGILIDAGLSYKEIRARLDLIGASPDCLRAVCFTHEHGDHTSALSTIHKRLGVDLYANSATIDAIESGNGHRGLLPWKVFTVGGPVRIGGLVIEPFSVPHDSYDPVGFVVSGGDARVAIATDIGMVTSLVRERFRGCHAIVIEANHDEQMLRDASRPWSLKQRIMGRQGHLSNDKAAELVAEVAGPDLRCVILAHLSADCNRPELALRAVNEALRKKGCDHVAVHVAYSNRVSEVVRI